MNKQQVIILLGQHSSGKSHWAMNRGPLYSFIADHIETDSVCKRLHYRLIDQKEPGIILKGIYTEEMLDAVYSYLKTIDNLHIVFKCFSLNKKKYRNVNFATMDEVKEWMKTHAIE